MKLDGLKKGSSHLGRHPTFHKIQGEIYKTVLRKPVTQHQLINDLTQKFECSSSSIRRAITGLVEDQKITRKWYFKNTLKLEVI